MRAMRSYVVRVAARLAVVTCLAVAPAAAQPGTVERVEVRGLDRMTRGAFLEAFGVRAGDPYDPARLRAAVPRLWEMGLFQDIRIEAEDGPDGGKIVIVAIEEKPILSAVTYADNKALTQTQIEDRLREREADPEIGRPLDMKRIYRAESTIRDYLAEKGHLDPTVEAETRELREGAYAVHFRIRPGGKTRIRKIRFVGNEVFSDRRLRGTLRLTKPRKWYWPWSSKNLYHPVKWDQDVGSVQDLYRKYGYLDVEIRPPIIDIVSKDEDSEDVPPKKLEKVLEAQAKLEEAEQRYQEVKEETMPEGLKPRQQDRWREKYRKRLLRTRREMGEAQEKLEKAQRKAQPMSKSWIALTIPVNEGPQYETGEIRVAGNTVFPDGLLRRMIPLRGGDVLSDTLLRAGIGRIRALYGDKGHLYANVVRQIQRREDEPVADIRVNIEEDEPYRVESIEFVGNDSTQDRVLRREMRLEEEELFSRRKLNLSVTKVNQLGYFELTEEPVIEPIEEENKVRITMPGQERGRNEIQIGGGYSGLDGAFFQGFYSTRNFLGRGQIVSASLQIGGRANRYTVSFIEPWFLAKPIRLGFSLFRRDVDFGSDLSSTGKGGGIVIGRQIGLFKDVRLNYNFESLTSTGFTGLGTEDTNRISSLTPSFTYNRVNNPFRPSRGWSIQLQTQVAGGPVGGDTNFVKPVVTYTGFKRVFRRAFFGFHGQAGSISAFGEGAENTTTVQGVPRFERFWLGGDTLGPRVFDTRTVTPLRFVKLDDTGALVNAVKDPTGLPISEYDRNGDGVLDERDLVEVGGDRFFLLQSELVYPLNEQFDLSLFLDVGNSLFEDTSFGFEDVRMSAGLEFRFYLPVFPVPLRLIYGFPIQKLDQDETSNFTFSLGRSF